jgi:hypothetical protein
MARSNKKNPPSKLNKAAVAKAAKAFIRSNMGEDQLFPPIDDGNMGVCAYIASATSAAAMLALAKDLHKGVPLAQSFVFEPEKHSVITVVTSEDEPHLHLVVLDRESGSFTPITDLNVPDLSGAFPKVFKRRFPDITEEYPDWGDLMTRLLSDGQYLDLGRGAAENLWWT